jgi:hypothetical protein
LTEQNFLDYYKLKDRYRADILSPGGMTMAGVIAPGIKLEYLPAEFLLVEVILATLFPHEKPAEGRDWYGWEGDLRLNFDVDDNKKLLVEVDTFQHGNVTKPSQGVTPDPAFRFFVGLYFRI